MSRRRIFSPAFINLWPPFLAAGIHVRRASPDLREINVERKE